MFDVLLWWLLVELIGLAVLPIAFRFFRNLPDRGYAFIKPLGLLLITYPFWLLTMLGFLTNTRGAIALVAIIVAVLCWRFGTRQEIPDRRQQTSSLATSHSSLVAWLRDNVSPVIATELVFTIAFFGWALVRAYMPEITATEKPMEFAFLNGVLQSERFPPLDPWLSGYPISYYYFGYIIVAMLTMLSGIVPSVAFNLVIALMFALAAASAFGLAYNLIRNSPLAPRNFQASLFALFAPVFLVVIGNLEGLFEVIHTRGWGPSEFWNWLDVKGLAQAPVTNTFVPTDNWWWWRASRVIHDFASGQTQEVIDEFPQFSFLLGDMHPHVLALPFVLLALGVALNLLNSRFDIQNSTFGSRVTNYRFLLVALVLGGLFFLNSWDILPYGFILVVAFAVACYRSAGGWTSNATRDLVTFVAALGALCVVLYLPFYIGFQSQAGGILPVLHVKTRLHQYLLMFGIFVFIFGAFLARLMSEHREIRAWGWLERARPFLAAAIAFPILIAGVALGVLAVSPVLREQAQAALSNASDNLLVGMLAAYFGPWLSHPWLFAMLAMFLAVILVLLCLRRDDESTLFALLVTFTGFLLTFGVEFVYLRDQFGTRMNTVFKFYFQAWTLFSIAAAYAVFYLSRALNGIARGVWLGGLTVLLGASMIYPALAIPNRADDFKKAPTLDGIAWIREYNPSDYEAIQWLRVNAPRGAVVLESTGREYSYDNRISMATGLPTVLGWAGHESQWHGGSRLYKDDATGIDRAADIARIYQTLDPEETLTLLNRYAIRFVVIGRLEREQYGLAKPQIEKFGKVMSLVFENGDVRIYARSN